MMGSLKTQLYLDSEETIINDLRDTFSCKNSNDSTNVLKINTSTYSVTRTANHISQRLEDASKRLQTIQTSVHKSRCSLNKSQPNFKRNMVKIGKSMLYCHNCGNDISGQVKQLEQQNKNDQSEEELIEMIRKISIQLKLKNKQIQELDQKQVNTQNQILINQQKYLRLEKTLRIQINRLKDLLNEKERDQNNFFNDKIQLQRQVDQNKLRVCQLEHKMKNLQEYKRNWSKKQGYLKRVTKRFLQSQGNQEVGVRSSHKKQRAHTGTKQIINALRSIIQFNVGQNDQDKQNDCEFMNRRVNGNNHGAILREQGGNSSYRSCGGKVQKQLGQASTYRNISAYTEQQQQEQHSNKSQELYRMLFIQAGTIQRFTT